MTNPTERLERWDLVLMWKAQEGLEVMRILKAKQASNFVISPFKQHRCSMISVMWKISTMIDRYQVSVCLRR